MPLSWRALADLPWIYPTASACCGKAAERLFTEHGIRPARVISVDRPNVTRVLIAEGVGVGLLHDDTAKAAAAQGELELRFEAPTPVRVLFACLTTRGRAGVERSSPQRLGGLTSRNTIGVSCAPAAGCAS